MTSNARHLRWKIACLALVLICQTTQQTEGHPRADQVTRRPPMKRDLTKHQNTSTNETDSVSPRPEQTSSRENHERSTVDTLDGKIIFPSDDDDTRKIKMSRPPTCQGSTFCENVSYYPRNLVDLAIQQNSSLKLLTSVDIADIEERINALDETPLCNSNEKVVFPQSAENIRNEWLYVVNQENFKQGVRVEICSNEEQKCNVIDGFSDNYQTMCKQKYISRELVALGSNGKVITDTFRFPASCCCHVKYTGGPTPRSAR